MLRFVQLVVSAASLTALWLSPPLSGIRGVREAWPEPRRLQALQEAEPWAAHVPKNDTPEYPELIVEAPEGVPRLANASAKVEGALAERRLLFKFPEADPDAVKDAKSEVRAGIGGTLALTMTYFATSGTDWDKEQINAVVQSTKSVLTAVGTMFGPKGMLLAGVAGGIFDALNPLEDDDDLDQKLRELKEDRAHHSFEKAHCIFRLEFTAPSSVQGNQGRDR